MTILKFNDGISIETAGNLRVVCRRDGYYVVGRGMCCPVDSKSKGEDLIRDMEKGDRDADRN